MAERQGTTDLLARVRRDVDRSILRSRNGLKLLSGVGRPVLGQTPKDTVWTSGKVELWRYRSTMRNRRPPLFFVHSLVSRSYVFDLAPGNSFIEFMLARGFDVFLVNWGEPDELEAGNTLETYCDELLPDLVAVVASISGSETVNMFGYCFGGLLSLLYMAGHAGGPVENLAVMATPVDFSEMGAMSSILQNGRVNPDDLIDETGNVPAEVIYNSFKLVQPTGDLTNYANLWQHLWNDDYVSAHQIMTGWAKDHIPFPGACMRQVSERFSQNNLLATGRVPMGDRTVDLADITVPFLNIIGQKDHIVTPAAVGPLTSLVGSSDREELRLPAGHVGLIVGRSAQQKHLPAMADWLERHSEVA
ncbi:MAG: poly[(R)-3-hydroxyalkanoate] polymerase subunit PhaC [Acidimicrobiaceae bacterium]|nr:poly[(R)-3-hydroxyalkanoate] polymerase subunit PhaC [Acidimicrobiaceae bacterium]